MEIYIRPTGGNYYEVRFEQEGTKVDIGFMNRDEFIAFRKKIINIAEECLTALPFGVANEIRNQERNNEEGE